MGSVYAIGLVIFNDERFLLLESETGYWNFMKKLVLAYEVNEQKAREIVTLELGVVPFVVKGFRESEEYFFKEHKETMHKEVVYFFVEVSSRDIKIPVGFLDYAWLCYEDAMRRLSFKKTKDILGKAKDFMRNK